MAATGTFRADGRHTTVGSVARRGAWLAVGLGALAFGGFEVTKHDLGWLPLIGFLILPDLAMLAGIGRPHQRRQMPARAVPLYNVLHHPILPIVLLLVAAAGILPLPWFVAGLGWLAHIGIDRFAGYNFRTPDGWIRG